MENVVYWDDAKKVNCDFSKISYGCKGCSEMEHSVYKNSFRVKPLVSIITVVKNDEHGLLRTIRSVSNHKWSGLEYIVIDGGSTDGTLEKIRQNETCITHWISEQDSGIYDAMNKGITLSSGDYLLFLNSGDELVADLDALSAIFAEGYFMVYGKANMLHKDGSLSYVKGKQLKSLAKLIRGTPLCHQAILYKKDAIVVYDCRYRIIADRVLTYELVKRDGLNRSKFVDIPIANYYEGGYSRQHEEQWKDEEFQFQREAGYYLYASYRQFSWWFKKNVTRPLQKHLRKEEHSG